MKTKPLKKKCTGCVCIEVPDELEKIVQTDVMSTPRGVLVRLIKRGK
jgi:hypothetical protein